MNYTSQFNGVNHHMGTSWKNALNAIIEIRKESSIEESLGPIQEYCSKNPIDWKDVVQKGGNLAFEMTRVLPVYHADILMVGLSDQERTELWLENARNDQQSNCIRSLNSSKIYSLSSFLRNTSVYRSP